MTLGFSQYDRRNYPILEVRDGYRLWAPTYDDGLGAGDLDLALLTGLRAVDWAVARAVDLACGTGRMGTWLRDHGAAHVDGVDLTPEMLALAEERGVYAQTLCEDIRETSLPAGQADLVLNVLSVEHLPELPPFYDEVARLLRARGVFVLVGYHPHFLLRGIPTHFRHREEGNIAIENHIHLFSDHTSTARALGFELLELAERVVSDEWVERQPSWERHRGHPVSFAMVWRRA